MNESLIIPAIVCLSCLTISVLASYKAVKLTKDINFRKVAYKAITIPLCMGGMLYIYIAIYSLFTPMTIPALAAAVILSEVGIINRLMIGRRVDGYLGAKPIWRQKPSTYAWLAHFALFGIGCLLIIYLAAGKYTRLDYGILALPLVQYIGIYLSMVLVSLIDTDKSWLKRDATA